jgi:hypothetical protein
LDDKTKLVAHMQAETLSTYEAAILFGISQGTLSKRLAGETHFRGVNIGKSTKRPILACNRMGRFLLPKKQHAPVDKVAPTRAGFAYMEDPTNVQITERKITKQ